MISQEIEQRVLEQIDETEVVELTKQLVAFPTENPPGDYQEISQFIAEKYRELGLEVQILSGEPEKPNICGRWQGDGTSEEILLLSGHMDVVPAGEGWKTNPFIATLEGNKLFGRGTADMKGALAAQIIALKALKKAGIHPKGTLYLCATVDDEIAGKMGLRYVINEGLSEIFWPKPTFHILGEPSKLNLDIAFKGRIWVKIGVEGHSAHGGNPSAGINAIEKIIKVMNRILDFKRLSHPLMGTDTINIGTIEGGEKTHVVPAYCSMTIDYRFVTPQTAAEIENKIRKVCEDLEEEDDQFKLKEFTIFECRDPREVSQESPYIVNLKNLTEEILDRKVSYQGVLSAGDAYWTLSARIPAVFYGPGDLGVAHTNGEFLPMDELLAVTKIFSLYVLRTLCRR